MIKLFVYLFIFNRTRGEKVIVLQIETETYRIVERSTCNRLWNVQD